ncbi:DUF4917 family protein [Nodularia harveyana UHCC-0300]|uniref:DUF4917 family protein n=1 Tax=Nodularia harveyana UHCC-0300 TaxID=2974287 RepID=A0ABU5U9K9_9CYAN|nr:DUF4917 family protein [Nodularia harveyana]MEA5580189.1 DUF4917 family protein [Nodularia harveyana UHCC-0300]
MISFDEAMATVEDGDKPSILLGNGFSLAWRNDLFNYANLLEVADFTDRNDEIKALFQLSETYDFEAVMRSLVAAKTVLQAYGGNEALVEIIEKDQQLLKDALITAISTTHPSRPTDVTNDQFTSVRRFLSRYDQIFTVNYDLLFYWARNMNDLPPENYSTDDGFRTGCKWQGHGTNQKAHFLHGGLHIFDSGTAIEKHTYTQRGTGIIDLVKANLEKGKFPLFVSEPTSIKKKQKIEHNPYLNYCFRALETVTGTFFIQGHSMDENDKHIFDQLRRSNVQNFFVSIFGDEDSEDNRKVKANARAYLESSSSNVEFFDAQSAPIWS